MNFLGVESYSYEDCNVLIVPYGTEENVSYGTGTLYGPQAIIHASQEVELYPYPKNLKIHTLSKTNDLSQTVQQAKEDGKFVMILGGDHSLTSHAYQHYNTDIAQFDAHCDLRDNYLGNPQSHACAMRRCMELNEDTNLYSFGIRNMSKSEDEYIKENKHRIHRDVTPNKKDIYLTFDVDALMYQSCPLQGLQNPEDCYGKKQ